MSNVSNIHSAVIYESKGPNKTQAFSGQRLVVTIAKADKNGNYGPHLQQTMATSIPTLSRLDIDFSESKIQEVCVEYFKDVQNQLIASRIKSGNKDISTEELHVMKLCEFLESENSSDKWTSERIASWFMDNLAESIGVALLEKGFNEEKMELSLKKYQSEFSTLFSSKTSIPRNKAVAMKKALDLAPDELKADSQYCKFMARIQKTLEEQNLDELLGL